MDFGEIITENYSQNLQKIIKGLCKKNKQQLTLHTCVYGAKIGVIIFFYYEWQQHKLFKSSEGINKPIWILDGLK